MSASAIRLAANSLPNAFATKLLDYGDDDGGCGEETKNNCLARFTKDDIDPASGDEEQEHRLAQYCERDREGRMAASTFKLVWAFYGKSLARLAIVSPARPHVALALTPSAAMSKCLYISLADEMFPH